MRTADKLVETLLAGEEPASSPLAALQVAQLPANPENPTPDELDEFAGSQYHWNKVPGSFDELFRMLDDQLYADYSENELDDGDSREDARQIIAQLQQTGKAVNRWYTFILPKA